MKNISMVTTLQQRGRLKQLPEQRSHDKLNSLPSLNVITQRRTEQNTQTQPHIHTGHCWQTLSFHVALIPLGLSSTDARSQCEQQEELCCISLLTCGNEPIQAGSDNTLDYMKRTEGGGFMITITTVQKGELWIHKRWKEETDIRTGVKECEAWRQLIHIMCSEQHWCFEPAGPVRWVGLCSNKKKEKNTSFGGVRGKYNQPSCWLSHHTCFSNSSSALWRTVEKLLETEVIWLSLHPVCQCSGCSSWYQKVER